MFVIMLLPHDSCARRLFVNRIYFARHRQCSYTTRNRQIYFVQNNEIRNLPQSKMDSDDEKTVCAAFTVVCAAAAAHDLKIKTKKKTKRRWWTLSLNRSRNKYNASNMLEDMNREPSGKFHNFCRMSATDFEHLIKIGPIIMKEDTSMRKAIPVQERLAITLRFLASGDSFTSLSYLFKCSNQVISNIVHEVCNALVHELRNYVKLPATSQDWQNISNEFNSKWNFPNCVGAIDGKHIIIQSPMNSGSEFINYKGTFSVVLMALVDADYCFTFADVGCQGRISDDGVIRNITFLKKMENHQLELPSDHPLPGKELPTPYVFLADNAFALSRHILKPYKGVYSKGSPERIFNYRLSRARRIVENVFGIMASVFRILRKPMLLQPEKVSVIVMTCVLLHNYLRKSKTSSSKYASRESFDNEDEGRLIHGSWRQDNNMTSMLPIRKIPRRSAIEAQDIRETFTEYFMTNGKVPWQENYC